MAGGLEVGKKIGKISKWQYHEHLCTYLRRSLGEGSLTEIQKLGIILMIHFNLLIKNIL
jgi:hypothetical protein